MEVEVEIDCLAMYWFVWWDVFKAWILVDMDMVWIVLEV